MMKKSQNPEPTYVLVYSTDPQRPNTVSGQKTAKLAGKPYVRLEKKGRGGKSVTMARRLPPDEAWLKGLSSHLKRSLGVGGTYYLEDGEGVVEVQGDHQAQVVNLLAAYQHPKD